MTMMSEPRAMTIDELMALIKRRQAARAAKNIASSQPATADTPYGLLQGDAPVIPAGVAPGQAAPHQSGFQRVVGALKAGAETGAGLGLAIGAEIPGIRNTPSEQQFRAKLEEARARRNVSTPFGALSRPLEELRALREAEQGTDLPSGQMPLGFGRHQQVGVKGALELAGDPLNLVPGKVFTKPLELALSPATKVIKTAAAARVTEALGQTAVKVGDITVMAGEKSAPKVVRDLVRASEAGAGGGKPRYSVWKTDPWISREQRLAAIAPEHVMKDAKLALGILASDVPGVRRVVGLINPTVRDMTNAAGRAVYVYGRGRANIATAADTAVRPLKVLLGGTKTTTEALFGLAKKTGLTQRAALLVEVAVDAEARLAAMLPSVGVENRAIIAKNLQAMPIINEYGLQLADNGVIILNPAQREYLTTVHGIRSDAQKLALYEGLPLTGDHGIDWANRDYFPREGLLSADVKGELKKLPPPVLGYGAAPEFEHARTYPGLDGLARRLAAGDVLVDDPVEILARFTAQVFRKVNDNELFHSVESLALRGVSDPTQKIADLRVLKQAAEEAASHNAELLSHLTDIQRGRGVAGATLNLLRQGPAQDLFTRAMGLPSAARAARVALAHETRAASKAQAEVVRILKAELDRINSGQAVDPIAAERLKSLGVMLPDSWSKTRFAGDAGAGYMDTTLDKFTLPQILTHLDAWRQAARDTELLLKREATRLTTEAQTRSSIGKAISARSPAAASAENVARREIGRWQPFKLEWMEQIGRLRVVITDAAAQSVFPVPGFEAAKTNLLNTLDEMSKRLLRFEAVTQAQVAKEFRDILSADEGKWLKSRPPFTPASAARTTFNKGEAEAYASLRTTIQQEMDSFWAKIKQATPDWSQTEDVRAASEIAQANVRTLSGEMNLRLGQFGEWSTKTNEIVRQLEAGFMGHGEQSLRWLKAYAPDVAVPFERLINGADDANLRVGIKAIRDAAAEAAVTAKKELADLTTRLAEEEGRAKQFGPGEIVLKKPGGGDVGGLSSLVFPKEVGDKLASTLGLKNHNWVETTMQHAGRASDVIRLTKTGLDFGAPFLQGFPSLFQNPVRWSQAAGRHYGYWWDALAKGDFTAHYKFLAANSETFAEMSSSGVHIFSAENEVFQALQRGEALDSLLTKSNLLSRGAKRLTSAFSYSYSSFNTEIQALYWQANRDKALKWATKLGLPAEDAYRDLADMTNNITGNLSLDALGVGRTQKIAESTMLFFSPRYTRASLAVMSDVLSGGVRGQAARDAMLRMLALGMASYYAIAKAKGEDPHLDPTKGNFLTIEIAGQPIGPGSFYRSFARLTGQIISSGVEDPVSLLKVQDVENNPITRWVRGRMAPVGALTWDIARGRDFVGYPLENPVDWGRRVGRDALPLWIENSVVADPFRMGAPGLLQVTGINAPSLPASIRLREARDIEAQKQYQKNYAELNRLQKSAVDAVPDIATLEATVQEFRAKTGSATEQHSDAMFDEIDRTNKQWESTVKAGEEAFASGLIDLEQFRKNYMREASAARAARMSDINNAELYPEFAAAREEMKKAKSLSATGDAPEDAGYSEYVSIFQSPEWQRSWGYDYAGRDKAVLAWRTRWGDAEYQYVLKRQAEYRYASPLVEEYYKGLAQFRYYWDATPGAVFSARRDGTTVKALYEAYQQQTELQQDAMRKAYPNLNAAIATMDAVKAKLRANDAKLDAFLFRWGYTGTLASLPNKGAEVFWRTYQGPVLDWAIPQIPQEAA